MTSTIKSIPSDDLSLMDTLVPTIPFDSKKKRRIMKQHAKAWVIKEIHSSAAPNLKLSHWTPRSESSQDDYPFAKFNRKIDILIPDDQEYQLILSSDGQPPVLSLEQSTSCLLYTI